jgi:hypothetical protein
MYAGEATHMSGIATSFTTSGGTCQMPPSAAMQLLATQVCTLPHASVCCMVTCMLAADLKVMLP